MTMFSGSPSPIQRTAPMLIEGDIMQRNPVWGNQPLNRVQLPGQQASPGTAVAVPTFQGVASHSPPVYAPTSATGAPFVSPFMSKVPATGGVSYQQTASPASAAFAAGRGVTSFGMASYTQGASPAAMMSTGAVAATIGDLFAAPAGALVSGNLSFPQQSVLAGGRPHEAQPGEPSNAQGHFVGCRCCKCNGRGCKSWLLDS